MVKKKQKVFVSGFFDMFHSGHIAFLKEAANYGEVYVGLGSDSTIRELKGREPINNEDERLYILSSLSCVKKAMINTGKGFLDFIGTLDKVKPDVFIVNADGHSIEKENICKERGIEYLVLQRIPYANLPARSSSGQRRLFTMPYRIDLAGTWIDQPYVSKFNPGAAITASIEPTIEFNERSGMATSTRKKAIELWNDHLPLENPEKLARMLFRYDNDPGTTEISGSQDSIGIAMPGINKFWYESGKYWPSKIETTTDPDIIKWLEDRLYMVTLWPRPSGYNVLSETYINTENVRKLANSAEITWEGLINKDIIKFSEGFLNSFESQIKMFPLMINNEIQKVIDDYKDKALAWKLSGAGGGGYLILISEKNIPNAFTIKIRHKELNL